MTDTQFILYFIVHVAGALAMCMLAALAIWGNTISARWAGPRLKLSLHDPEGQRIDVASQSSRRPARYYHLRLTNSRGSARAHNTRVMITKVSRPWADGKIVPQALSGPIPLVWQYADFQPQYPTIGPDMICDLGFLLQGGVFQLSMAYIPSNLNSIVKKDERIQVDVIAMSDECQSNPLRIEIAWDGLWNEGTNEMKQHMVVREVPCT